MGIRPYKKFMTFAQMAKKILIIRFSSIGDIVLTSPVIRCVKQQTEAEVHYLTKPQYKPVIEANPHIDCIHTFTENEANAAIRALRAEEFDWVADLHHNLRSLRIKRALQRRGRAFPKLNFEKWLIVNLKFNRLPDSHIVDRYLETVQLLGVTNDGKGLEHFLPPDVAPDLSPFGLKGQNYIAISVGAAHATKCLEDQQIVTISDQLQLPVILLGGPAEEIRGEAIARATKSRVINMCGRCGINTSAWLVKNSAVTISPDTAMMHFAAAFRTPLISVWGNTIPEFGMYPYYGDQPGKHVLFEIHGLTCRPCSKIGFEKCPKDHFRCIRDLDVTAIAEAANSWL